MKIIEKTSIEIFDDTMYKVRVVESLEDDVMTLIEHDITNDKRDFIKDKIEFKKHESSISTNKETTFQQLLFKDDNIQFPSPLNPKFTFIDLFAGIGGFRLAMQSLGGKCVFTSEWDVHAQKTYKANFGEVPFGDITKEETKSYIPDNFDVLCAGFPCQAFSIAGKRGGFEDTRGTLFFDVAEIIKRKKPKAVLLENVRGLTTHDGGKTLQVIISALEELGYKFFYEVLNAKDFSVPQDRKRIYIVGFRKDILSEDIKFKFPKGIGSPVYISEFLEENVKGYSISEYLQSVYIFKKDDGKPQLVDKDTHVHVKTLVSTYHKIQRLTSSFVKDGETGLRLLTVNECKAIMGFDKEYIIPVSRTQMYRQLGNSVAVPVVKAVANKILDVILNVKSKN
jgi:DNA (cytosine-5)-methyltransferase 1